MRIWNANKARTKIGWPQCFGIYLTSLVGHLIARAQPIFLELVDCRILDQRVHVTVVGRLAVLHFSKVESATRRTIFKIDCSFFGYIGLHVQPKRGRGIVFYSLQPDGFGDEFSCVPCRLRRTTMSKA